MVVSIHEIENNYFCSPYLQNIMQLSKIEIDINSSKSVYE
jgi:hypothetical protein